ncbi:MAG TPA: bifunctional adenosylcobinamide kinase/adenosylcobinamide-phosphate guanylyltransferase [Nitrospira sp.]
MTSPKRRSQFVVVLGGASSGKSDAALLLAEKGIGGRARRAFVATSEGLDEEMAQKIARHRQSRSPEWKTADVPIELTQWMDQQGRAYRVIVIDCLTMWLSNQCGKNMKPQEILDNTRTLIAAIRRLPARVVVVTNELGMGLVPVDSGSREFRELAGSVNRLVAAEADEAYLVVSGLSVQLK